MAIQGDGIQWSQLSLSRNGSTRRRSEFGATDQAVAQRKSGHSFAASSAGSLEKRVSPQQGNGNNQNTPTYEPEVSEKALSPSSAAASGLHKPPLRSIPAWVRRPEGSEDGNTFASALPSQPSGARVAEHHFAPSSEYSQLGDQSEPSSRESRWKTFTQSTAYPRPLLPDENVVSYEWLNENMGDYSEPWQGKQETTDVESGRQKQSLNFFQRRKMWMARFQFTMLHSPMVPLAIRLTVFLFCLIALALGGSILHYSTKYERPQGASTYMAIIVDAVALAYLVYITYDEYTGKPLGLRPATAKMRLIFLDLIFIVLASANLSLAFDSLSTVTGSCTSARVNDTLDQRNDMICVRQEALASVLLIVLIAWLMTFAISVLRLVERVSSQ